MRRPCGRVVATAMLMCSATITEAVPYDEVVGINAPDGGAVLAKRFAVAAGAAIVGVEVATNDLRTVFPRVAVYRGRTSRLSDATLVWESGDVRALARHHVTLPCGPIVNRTAEEYYVAVTWPPSDGVRGVRDGAAIPCVSRASGGDSYIASGIDKELQRVEGLDLGIRLIMQEGVAKSGASEDPPAVQVWRTFFERDGSVLSAGASFRFGVESATQVTLAIYDVRGRLVRTIVDESLDSGEYQRSWDALNAAGAPVAAGVYVARFTAGSRTFNQKVVLAR